jgi:hypothetical protein
VIPLNDGGHVNAERGNLGEHCGREGQSLASRTVSPARYYMQLAALFFIPFCPL